MRREFTIFTPQISYTKNCIVSIISARDLAASKADAISQGTMKESDASNVFDSNCITPGTEFLLEVAENLRFYIRVKIKEDSIWRRLKVIFSGPEVPGEGEHKVMEYIRNTKMQPGYSPNLRHFCYGLDADLIMLSLATHEPHFSLLREEVDFMSYRDNPNATKTITRYAIMKYYSIAP